MNTVKDNYFLEFRVWHSSESGQAIKYICFQSLLTKKYCVQSSDRFYLPIDKNQIHQSELQAIELFMEISPHERCEWFDSLEEAINQHNMLFSS